MRIIVISRILLLIIIIIISRIMIIRKNWALLHLPPFSFEFVLNPQRPAQQSIALPISVHP